MSCGRAASRYPATRHAACRPATCHAIVDWPQLSGTKPELINRIGSSDVPGIMAEAAKLVAKKPEKVKARTIELTGLGLTPIEATPSGWPSTSGVVLRQVASPIIMRVDYDCLINPNCPTALARCAAVGVGKKARLGGDRPNI